MAAQIDEAPLATALHQMKPFGNTMASPPVQTPASSMKERFYRYFQEEVTELQEQIEQLQHRSLVGGERQDAIDHALAGISRLSNETADASEYLPAYDQRTYSQAIKALAEHLNEVRQKIAPKKKFSFRPSTMPKNSSAISLTDAAELAQSQRLKPPVAVHALDSSTESSAAPTPAFLKTPPGERNDALGDLPSFLNTESTTANAKNYNLEMSRPGVPGGGPIRKPSFSQASHVQISDHTGLHIILPSSASHATSSGSLTKLSKCIVDMSVPTTSTSGAAFLGLMLQNIKSSLIIAGQVAGAAHITAVSNSVLVVAARQVRIHDCKNIDIYLLCSSRPIIEDCEGVRFAPLPAVYAASLPKEIRDEKNMYDQVDDFKWLKKEHSPHWSVMNEEKRLSEEVWTKTVPGGGGLGLDDILRKVGIQTR